MWSEFLVRNVLYKSGYISFETGIKPTIPQVKRSGGLSSNLTMRSAGVGVDEKDVLIYTNHIDNNPSD